jgi:glycine/D-amino acid oxidase-like deaminating enzyme
MKHTAHGYWLAESGPPDPLPAAEGELDCDLLVVGGGYTGMWTAWHAHRLAPEARIVLLEAGGCGRGPSGRNGGFVNAMWFNLPAMREGFGDRQAIELARAAQHAVADVGEFCSEQGVDAWYRARGYLQVSSSAAHDEAWSAAIAACRALGEADQIVALGPDEVAKRCSSPRFRAGALYPGSATVQPARLALGLRDRLAATPGVEIFEQSPVRRIRAGGWGCAAETNGARVRAGSAVLALGCAAGAAGSPLRGGLAVTSSHIALTEPVPELLEEIGWTGGECISDSRNMVRYMRTTPDARIAFGWGGGRVACGARLGGRTELDPAVVSSVVADLREIFPGLAGRRITHAWGGPIDVAPTHLPTVTRIGSDRVHAAFGYTGNGVGPSHMVGRILSSLALDRRDDHSRLALVDPDPRRIPSGIAGWLGGNAVRAGVVRVEQAEAEGRRADPLSRGLATIPELIGFHIGR